MDVGVFTSTQFSCEFCGKNHKGQHCPFDIADDVTMGDVIRMIKHDRDFELIAQWHVNTIANLKPLENPDFEVVNLSGMSQSSAVQKMGSGGTTIYDCLSWFSTEETLTGNDKWYCAKCKNHVNALKKMEVYRAPEFLIIHLKRFSHQRASFFSSKKINELINFPIEGLDLSEYVLQNTQQASGKKGQESYVYDLYAVSNHFGSLNGGHYTAYAQNPIDRKWYDFDDSDVSRLDPSSVVTKAAYVLFYRRRKPAKK